VNELTVERAPAAPPLLKLHLEPAEPIEIGELTGALGALSRQYQTFVEKDGALGKSADARLLVWSVAPGSIDIAFLPDLKSVAGLLAAAYDPFKHLVQFAEQVARLYKIFSVEKPKDKPESGITIKDCDDAVALSAPITNHGGNQSVTIINGDVIVPVISMTAEEARRMTGNAQQTRALLAGKETEMRQRVPLIWKRLDRGKARTETAGSPDRAKIDEIDGRDRPTFFTDETTYLKDEMIGEDENPWQRVYFVDVEVSRHEGKVVSYRIVGYHGKEDLD
jgi:hypothetical protein